MIFYILKLLYLYIYYVNLKRKNAVKHIVILYVHYIFKHINMPYKW